MARIHFTPQLERHVQCPTVEAAGSTLREVLEGVFEANPRLRGYLFDDQGRLRQHVVAFVDGQQAQDRRELSDPVSDETEVYVMQALSGG